LAQRGLGEEVLRAFDVGYAPSAWDTVLLRGQRAGFKVEELRGVGLAQRGRGGGEYDRFRSRIMFPIRDRRGRTLGFGGRAMRSDQGAKYVNTAETDFFHKSQMLYGIDLAKAAIAKVGRAVVVEGYTDVLALHQAGVEEAVGVMGTAITEEQVAALSGMVDEVVLALDADAAGQEAMLRAQRVAAGRKMRLRVAAMPAGEDPAEMIAGEGGAERFQALVDQALELTAFQVGLVIARTDSSSPAERDRALDMEIAPILAGMGEGASRDDLIRQVAEKFDMEPAMVMGKVVAARPLSGGPAATPGSDGPAPTPRRTAELTSRERRERALLAMCIALPVEGKDYLTRLTEEHLSPSGLRAAEWLREHPEDPASSLPRDDSELAGLIAELVILAHDEPASPEAMELNYLLLEQRRIEAEIATAGEKNDYERRAALSRDRAALVERIARTERVGG
jgi:DNA primase